MKRVSNKLLGYKLPTGLAWSLVLKGGVTILGLLIGCMLMGCTQSGSDVVKLPTPKYATPLATSSPIPETMMPPLATSYPIPETVMPLVTSYPIPETLRPTAIPNSTKIIPPPIVSPYIDVIVENVEIRYLKTNPVQVELVIRGTLPDQCKYGFYSIENRKNLSVKISLSGIHPADNSCANTIQTIEYVLLLGRDVPESQRGFTQGNYDLMVNNYKTTFSIK